MQPCRHMFPSTVKLSSDTCVLILFTCLFMGQCVIRWPISLCSFFARCLVYLSRKCEVSSRDENTRLWTYHGLNYIFSFTSLRHAVFVVLSLIFPIPNSSDLNPVYSPSIAFILLYLSTFLFFLKTVFLCQVLERV